MKLAWKQSINIPDGMHQGKIVRVEYRTEPFEYTDVIIQLLDDELELKYGCPTILSEGSKLGELLQTFGNKVEVNKEIDIDAALVGKMVNFMTLKKKGSEGKEYAEIVRGSVKPI